jgi:ribosome recycling factor
MLDEIFKDVKARMKKSVDATARELATIRTGKATPQLLDTVKVEAYGTTMPLNQVATITVPEPRLLVVQAFDKSTVGNISKAIQKADLGLNPMVDGHIIRLPIPALNEERRKDLVKQCKHLAEEGKVAVRNVRRDANEHIKHSEKDHKISEDDAKHGLDEIQKFTDDHIHQIDTILVKKEKEVMEV